MQKTSCLHLQKTEDYGMKSKSVKKIVLGFVIGAILVVSLIGCKDAEETVPEASTSEVISEVESEVI